jgi:hypothetical protein
MKLNECIGLNASFETTMGCMAHHKPRIRYNARYANPHLNQYRYNYAISFQTQKLTPHDACSHLSECASP